MAKIPDTVSDLQKLSGVGRKTAQVVVNVAFDTAALPVDTHVYRTSHRIGLVTKDANTPTKVERQLKRIIPREDWGDAHHLLILHGRYTCTARSPSCELVRTHRHLHPLHAPAAPTRARYPS